MHVCGGYFVCVYFVHTKLDFPTYIPIEIYAVLFCVVDLVYVVPCFSSRSRRCYLMMLLLLHTQTTYKTPSGDAILGRRFLAMSRNFLLTSPTYYC